MVSTGTGARIGSASRATGHAATPRNKLDKKGLDGTVDFFCGQASGLHKEDLCSSKETLCKILHYTSHQHTTKHRTEPISLCGLPSQRGREGHINQVLSLSNAPPAHRGRVGHPKHGRYAETRVGDQRDKKSIGKDR